MVSVRLTDKQELFIKNSNISQSDFIRRAVDYYILYLEHPTDLVILNELENWIQSKKQYSALYTNVTHMNTNVTQCNTDVRHMNTDVTQCNTNVTQTQKENKEKQTNNGQNNLKLILSEDFQMIQRILKNPENSDSIPDCTLKLLHKKHDVSKSAIQGFVTKNKDHLKSGEFEKI